MKISNDGALITFNSREPWYSKEKEGQKCNTVRRFKEDLEIEKVLSSLFTLVEIEIVDGATNQSFRRLISDISVFDGRIIFSWQHREE